MSLTPPPPPPPAPSLPSPSSCPRPRRPRKPRLAIPADSLLTFTSYTPPQPQASASTVTTSTSTSTRSNSSSSSSHNVHSNFRFLIHPFYPLSPQEPIPWSMVDVVILSSPPVCPICLYEPKPLCRMTTCGHVFHETCLRRYYEHAGTERVKCPICSAKITLMDMKRCIMLEMKEPVVGELFTLRLIRAEKGGGQVIAMGEEEETGVRNVEHMYARVGAADVEWLKDEVGKEVVEVMNINGQEEISIQEACLNGLQDELEMLQARDVVKTDKNAQAKDHWWFYQAGDTGMVFLHPVNHKCIAHEVEGRWEQASQQLEAKVVEIESYRMDNKLRKKYRFLEHLPNGCAFQFVELDLSHLLKPSTLETRQGELTRRRMARKKREQRMRKEDKLMKKRESESMRRYVEQQLNIRVYAGNDNETVDSQDTTSFPSLIGSSSNTATSPNDGTSNAWGEEVSSYSSVTSNMGEFPSLSQTTGSETQTKPRTGGGAWGREESGTVRREESEAVRREEGGTGRRGRRGRVILGNQSSRQWR